MDCLGLVLPTPTIAPPPNAVPPDRIPICPAGVPGWLLVELDPELEPEVKNVLLESEVLPDWEEPLVVVVWPTVVLVPVLAATPLAGAAVLPPGGEEPAITEPNVDANGFVAEGLPGIPPGVVAPGITGPELAISDCASP